MKMVVTLSLAFVVFFVKTGSAQQNAYIIKGKVIDRNTRQPLPFASVVAQNTTIGTLTDSAGAFTMRLPDGGYTISISYTGYDNESVRVNRQSADEEFTIEMNTESKSLEEVSVILDLEVKDGWEKFGQFFLENFIGKTNFSHGCVIKNPADLHFYLFKKRNTLKVISKEPVVVENFSLGYTLHFSIDSFTNNFTTKTSAFVGYPMFEEMVGTSEQKQLWETNRKNAYYGSLLHFMRVLYQKKLDEEGYEVRFFKTVDDKEPIAVKNVYEALNYEMDSSGVAQINPRFPVVNIIYHRMRPEINYLVMDPSSNKNYQVSTLVFDSKDPIMIEGNGYYYEQTELITNGYLGYKKIADMLPYNYQLPFSN